MNDRSDIERVLGYWLEDGPVAMPDRVVDVVARRISVRPQRRSWRLIRRSSMSPALKYGAAAAAVLVIAIVGYGLLTKGPSVGTPSPVPASPSAEPSPSSAGSPVALNEGPLSGGRYFFRASSEATVTITADVPAGWQGWDGSRTVAGPGELDPPRVSVVFQVADGLHRDPCHWDRGGDGQLWQRGDGVVGPTAIDLANALQDSSSYSSTTPSSVVVGGYEGYELEIRAPDDLNLEECDEGLLVGAHYYPVFSGQDAFPFFFGKVNRMHLYIADVEGTRIIASILFSDDTPPAEQEAARAIIESAEFTP